jgi:hypothetical protein
MFHQSSEYGTFDITQKLKNRKNTCIFFIVITFGLLLVTFPFISGIAIGSLYPSNITTCLLKNNDKSIDISNILLVILIGSIIQLPIVMGFYFYLVIVRFDMHSMYRIKDIFSRLRSLAGIFIITVSIFAWIVFCEIFYNCSRPPILILLIYISVFGVPLCIVLYNILKY